MRQQLTHFDIYDIFTFAENGDLCQFNKFSLTKDEFLTGDFFGIDSMPIKKYLLYFLMPTHNEVGMRELLKLIGLIPHRADPKELL